MYPDFQYLLQALFGTDMPQWLSLFKTFGFLVALSFIGAAWTIGQELKRKEKQGLLQPEVITMTLGLPVTKMELFFSALVGFIIGYKVGGIFTDIAEVSPDPMGYLLSLKGNIYGGLLVAAISIYTKYIEKKRQQLPEPVVKNIAIYPHERITEIVVVAAVGGLLGAKIFNALETWDDFIKDPIRSLTSSSGLTFLGGLIMATVLFYFYSRRHKIPFKHLCDAAAPGIMLAYGLGRLGCQFSGDGDWGIYNTAYITDSYVKNENIIARSDALHSATQAEGLNALHIYEQLHRLEPQPYTYFQSPSWMPRWIAGMNYPHNVGNEGIYIENCTGDYCSVLPASVFPTPVYEAIVCVMLFFLLWAMRKRFTRSLQMFGTYLMLVGIERFLVEKIRVNYKYDWGFIRPTQAEILSVVLVLLGAGLLLFYKEKQQLVQGE